MPARTVPYNQGVEFGMSRVEDIEDQVKSLNLEELKAFREWFASFDEEVWDAQIEADMRSGKLRSLVDRALRDHKMGQSSLL
jgi:hypothetical protein